MVVVVGGNVLHHVKREGDCPSGGNVQGNMSGDVRIRAILDWRRHNKIWSISYEQFTLFIG